MATFIIGAIGALGAAIVEVVDALKSFGAS
jgi:hypothetical protein